MMGSAPSYERVNYALRPNKAVARKILCEVFRRLVRFAPLREYAYVGFGSPFFSDFRLFHRALGMKTMVNIEREVDDEPRIRFNRPFGGIRCLFGPSAETLPKLRWAKRAIVWLDNDGSLDEDVLKDVRTVCARARSGSVLVLTFCAEWREEESGSPDWGRALEELRTTFGQKTPTEIVLDGTTQELTAQTAGEGGFSRALARIALGEMERVCLDRSGGGRAYRLERLLHFEYSDGTRMATVGGVILAEKDAALFEECDFAGLPLTRRRDSDPYVLKLPLLTHREMRHLDQRIPLRRANWKRIGLKERSARSYEDLYRWYPAFAETDL